MSSIQQWITWAVTLVVSIMVSAISLTAYVHTTFISKSDFENRRNDMTSRLDRIENKIDRIIEKRLAKLEKKAEHKRKIVAQTKLKQKHVAIQDRGIEHASVIDWAPWPVDDDQGQSHPY